MDAHVTSTSIGPIDPEQGLLMWWAEFEQLNMRVKTFVFDAIHDPRRATLNEVTLDAAASWHIFGAHADVRVRAVVGCALWTVAVPVNAATPLNRVTHQIDGDAIHRVSGDNWWIEHRAVPQARQAVVTLSLATGLVRAPHFVLDDLRAFSDGPAFEYRIAGDQLRGSTQRAVMNARAILEEAGLAD